MRGLFNGPQLGFAIPELFFEFELHSPRQDVRGVSAAGLPLVGIGHNGKVAWGFTSGLSDEDDLFAVRLKGPQSYEYRGETRAMSCRDETFEYKPPPTTLPDLVEDPGQPAGAVVERICRTSQGPVQFRGDGVAYARRYAIWNRELETLTGLTKLNDAETIGDVDEAMGEGTLGPRRYAKAARQAGRKLTQRFGTRSPSDWRADRLMYDVVAQGAATPPSLPFFDRGTWSQSLSMGRRGE